MPRSREVVPDWAAELHGLLQAAIQFVSRPAGEALVRAFLPRLGAEGMPEHRRLCMMADAALLSADLMYSQPSVSGSTAIDRLARSRGAPTPAMTALRGAEFRLLRLEERAAGFETRASDAVSGGALRLVVADLGGLPAGALVFGRVVVLGDGVVTFCGSVTPLDEDAAAVALGHPAACRAGRQHHRWAEDVYKHVVRHGTLDVPGLNRPMHGLDGDGGGTGGVSEPAMDLMMAWFMLEGETPDADLLVRTRQLADLGTIQILLRGVVAMRQDAQEEQALTLERMIVVMLDTAARRERIGSGLLGLATIRRSLEVPGAASAEERAVFDALRRRVPAAAPSAGDAGLERLVQVVQGLRAKTVEQGCTEQEALAAAAKVAELLDRYGMSLGELDFKAQPCEGMTMQTDRKRNGPIDRCVPAVASFFDCRVWGERAADKTIRYVFFGLRGDVGAAQYLHELVERAFETETDRFRAGALYLAMEGERRSATNSFQIGLADGIIGKLQAMRAERGTGRGTGRDLVPVKAAMVDEELDKLGISLRRVARGRGTRVLSDAFEAGQEAGREFEYRVGIAAAA